MYIGYKNHDVNSPRLEVSSEENDDEEDPSALVVKSMTILDYITSTCWVISITMFTDLVWKYGLKAMMMRNKIHQHLMLDP